MNLVYEILKSSSQSSATKIRHPCRQGSVLDSKCGLTRLHPDGIDLLLDLFDFLLVPSSFMVRDLCFKLLDFLGVLPGVPIKVKMC